MSHAIASTSTSGFDLRVKYRPGQIDRQELIGELRRVLVELEESEE